MACHQIKIDKNDFLEFLELAQRTKTILFSIDPDGRLFPSYEKGWSDKKQRCYIRELPRLLELVVDRHIDERPEGGRLRVDFQGAWSCDSEHYFILWDRSRDLIDYEFSVPLQSRNMIDVYAMMAKHRY